MRLAFFGGTFDPPHRGHLAVAQAAAETFHLDHVLFAPVGHQPLKPDAPTASYADRIAMVELAIGANARFSASELDAPRPDGAPNYTVDALESLRITLTADTSLFCIVGADSFLDLRRWRNPERLLELAEWIVVSRPGIALDLTPLHLTPAQTAKVHLLTNVHEDISATALREGRLAPDALPPAVAAYIQAHHLYFG